MELGGFAPHTCQCVCVCVEYCTDFVGVVLRLPGRIVGGGANIKYLKCENNNRKMEKVNSSHYNFRNIFVFGLRIKKDNKIFLK